MNSVSSLVALVVLFSGYGLAERVVQGFMKYPFFYAESKENISTREPKPSSEKLESGIDQPAFAHQPLDIKEGSMSTLSAVVLLKEGGNTQFVNTAFTEMGFDVQMISDSILLLVGESTSFEKSFDTKLQVDESGAKAADVDSESNRFLSTEALPASLKKHIHVIEFEKPPDFGPSDY